MAAFWLYCVTPSPKQGRAPLFILPALGGTKARREGVGSGTHVGNCGSSQSRAGGWDPMLEVGQDEEPTSRTMGTQLAKIPLRHGSLLDDFGPVMRSQPPPAPKACGRKER